MELISKEDAVALIKVEMDKIRTHSLVDGTARINLRLAKNIIEDMPTIDLTDYVPKDFHDKTCEAMAKSTPRGNSQYGKRGAVQGVLYV